MCFQYLKWADDYVDDPQNDKQSKLSFIDKQVNLVAELKDGEDSYLQQEEYLLYHLINYALAENKPQIINEIKESLESIKMDAVRIQDDGMFNQDEFSLYLRKVVQPVFNLTYYFLKPSAKLSDKDNYIGKFVWQVLIIRDFFEDIDSGYINIPQEEITKYKLYPDNLKKDENRFLWFKEKYPEYIKTLEDDIRIFRKMPLKIKLFWAPIYPYMIYELLKVKEYNYYFGDKHSKSIIKELKILGKTALSVTGFYLKIFI